MARRTKKQIQKERKIALILVGALLLAVLCTLILTVPGFTGWVFRLAGVTQRAVVPTTGADSPVALHVIDVGQGDAALLCDNGEYALWDAGPPEAADGLLAYLRAAGVEKLKYIFLTHPHADHYGGLQKVAEALPVERVVLPNLALAPYPTASSFLTMLAALNARGIPGETAAENATYPLGQGVVTVVHAGLETDDNYNLLSLGLRYDGAGLSVMNTGDGEKQNENAMLEAKATLAADVWLAGHHGSSTSNTAGFVQAVAPKLVVISCGAGNSYGHPHSSALKAFAAVDAPVLRTDRHGAVVVQPDGAGGLARGTAKTIETGEAA